MNEALSILLVATDAAYAASVRQSLVELGHDPVIAGDDAARALSRLPHAVAVVDTVGGDANEALSFCRACRAEVTDALVILLVDDPASLSDFGAPGTLYDDFMLRSSSALELQARIFGGLERVRQRRALRQRERQRILSQVVEFSRGLGPFLSPEELFQRVGRALMSLPEVRGVYAATHSERADEGLRVQLEMGVSAAPDPETAEQVLSAGRVLTRIRRTDVVCVVPLGAGPMGFLALRLSRQDSAPPALPLALAGLVSSAYASARLFESTKSRQLRLERGYLERHRQLARATAGLEQLSQVRDHFLAMLSHDLRSPLAVILASCQVLDEGLAGELNARQKRSVGVIFRQSTRMTNMVEELLDNYRAGVSAVPEFAEEVELGELVRRTMHGYREQFRDAGLVFEVRVRTPVAVRANPTTLREVICNIVDNAMKHASESVTLTIEGSERGVLLVHDDGPGFPEGVEARLTEKPEGEGSSMGLRLSASSVRRSDGEMTLENPPEGGALVRVVLPAAGARSEELRVLVGCGDMDRLEELVDILADGWSVSGASHSQEILKQLREGSADLLVLDSKLQGGRNGVELLAELKGDPALGVIPVLMICPPASPGLVERAHTLGALDVVERPVNGRVLLEHLDRAAQLSASSRVGVVGQAHDALTGLDTPSAVNPRIRRLIAESSAAKQALPALWVDVDSLHEVNQRMGYAAGDQLLLWTSTLLKKAVDPGAVISRYKGASFLLVLPGVSMERARAIGEQLEAEARETRPRLGAHRKRVEISVRFEDFSGGTRLLREPGDAVPPDAAN